MKWLFVLCISLLMGCGTTHSRTSSGDIDVLRVELRRVRRQLGETTTALTVIQKELEQQNDRQDDVIQDIQTLAAWQRALQDHVNQDGGRTSRQPPEVGTPTLPSTGAERPQ
jgi:hypothetical protein